MTDRKPSFTRALFAGAIHDELLLPYPPALDQRDPREARLVRRLIADLREMEESGLIDSARFDEEETIPEEVIRAFAEKGLLALTIPREYGGLGLSATGYARVFATLSTVDPSLAVLVGVHCGLGSKAIVLYGTEKQRRRWLPPLARGDILAAYALTEPETGSDAQNIVTKAERNGDGSWTLNGRKIWIGNGHRAGVIATFAQTGVERRGATVNRPTAFLITPDMPGFRVAGTFRKMGIRGSTQADLRYEDLRVPAENVLGQVGKGFSVAVHVLNGGRLTLAAGCTGGAKAILREMTSYASERVQFGRPIVEFEITQRKLATLAADTYAADAMLGILSSLMDRADSDYSLEAAAAKVFASELVWRAADELVQVAGGRGFVKPHAYERMLRDARINRIFEGTNEVLRLFIGLNGIEGPAEKLKEVGTALRRPLGNLGLLGSYAASRFRNALGATATLDAELHPRLAEHRKYLEKHVAELSAATQRAIVKHRREIIERQLVVERLANMAIGMFATAAVLARTQSLVESRGVDACANELAMCDLFCVEAGRRFRDDRLALDAREDEVDDRRRGIAGAVRKAGGYPATDTLLDEAPRPGARSLAEPVISSP